MRSLRRVGWLVLIFSSLIPVHAAELAAPTPAAETKAPVAATTTTSSTPASSTSKGVQNTDNAETRLNQPDTELIDVPTASIIDYGSFSSRSRLFANGGVVEWLSFGVFQRLNIGASLNVDKFIGTGSPVQITRPDLQVKFRMYDG